MKDPNVEKVTAFMTKLLTNIVTERAISVGIADLPVLSAFKALKPCDYKQVLRGLAAEPGVADFLAQIIQQRAAAGMPPMKDAEAHVRR